ncbi:DotA/TraY family protein [Pseudomonas syringae]|uniref:DotA/TraY family protein n=1 Tax=Pseudomonas syringae TaxID=317 RepID=UPI00246129E0|nr:DotA/TraY family protein [Pseudomonas syringae]MDH4602446.1 DotA/TraY family protein [Pseudomonas syringae pv. papulans]
MSKRHQSRLSRLDPRKLIGKLFVYAISAAVAPSAMADDVAYGTDFGQKVINWIAFGSDKQIWGTTSLMSVVSQGLNGIGLTVMAWLAVLGASTYVIQTANKGVPGGQVISSFWAPIRVAVATILLIPLTGGFSTLQYGVVAVAEKGNADANALMGMGLDYLYDFGAYRSPALEDGSGLIFSWIGSEVCKQYINSYTNREAVSSTFTQATDRNRMVSTLAYTYNEADTWMWRNDPRTDYCGALSFAIDLPNADDNTSAASAAPKEIGTGQLAILRAIQPKVAEIASMILSDEQALRDLQVNGAGSQSTYEQAAASVSKKISGAVSKYNAAVVMYNAETQKLVASSVNKINDSKNANKATDWKGEASSTGWKDQTKEMGWPALGTIFWQVNINQSEINKLAAAIVPTYTDPSLDDEWLKDPRLGELSSRIRGLKKAVAGNRPTLNTNHGIPSLTAIADAGAEGSGFMDKIKSVVYDAFAGAMKSMLYKNSPDDLIVNLQYFGSAAGTTAEVMWWAKVVTVAGIKGGLKTAETAVDTASNAFSWLGPVGWVAKGVAGTGKGVIAALTSFIDDISGLLSYLILGLIIVGFTLGIVLPTIPLTQWLMGVISWMLFYIECLLVSPIWLSAHGSAERDGWGSEHTRQGYMLMIGLYLNPILRVAGFFAIFLALKPVSHLVSWFIDYIQGVLVSGFAFLFYYFGAMAVVGIFSYSVLVRIFGLPSELFERGLRWVNGGQEVTGDSNSEERARSNIGAFAHKAEAAANSKGAPTKFAKPDGATPTPTRGPSS